MTFDIYIQMGHHTKARRLAQLFHEEEFLALFPGIQFEEAVQTGLPPQNCEQRTSKFLCLLRNFSAPSPQAFIEMFAASHLLRHGNRIFVFDTAKAVTVGSLAEVPAAAASFLPPPSHVTALRINAFPLALDTTIATGLFTDHGYALDPRAYSHAVHVVQMEDYTSFRVYATPADMHFRLPRNVKNPLQEEAASSAVNKLDEALLTAGFDPFDGCKVAAIDLGAAPGAWTQYLARRVAPSALVFAVDPAKLSDEVTAMPNVRHIRKRAEEAVDEVLTMAAEHQRTQAGGEPSSSAAVHVEEGAGAAAGLVDMVVCDINLAPRYTLPILTRVMRALRPGGLVVFTGKFQGAGDHAGGYIDFIRTALPQLRGTKCLWLLANTTHERTYIGWKRADGDAVARPDIGPTTFIRNSVSTSAEGTSDPSDRLQGPDEVSNRTRRDADKPGAGGNELATGVPIKSEVTEDGKFVILKKSWPFRIVL